MKTVLSQEHYLQTVILKWAYIFHNYKDVYLNWFLTKWCETVMQCYLYKVKHIYNLKIINNIRFF